MRKIKITGADGFAPSVNIILKPDFTKPKVLQEVASNGLANKYLAIGEEIIIPWTDYSGDTPVPYQYPFVVANIADVEDAHNVVHHNAVWLMAKYATPFAMVFDAPEQEIARTETFESDKYYYIKASDGESFTEQAVVYGDPIPSTKRYYYNYQTNMNGPMKYGYNRWSHSAIRQWLNSSADKNEGWWTSQHAGDSSPDTEYANKPGWMYGFDPKWKGIFKPIKVQTAANTETDGGVIDVTYDIFFLPSVEQMYGIPEVAGVEGEYWPYWKEILGSSIPINIYRPSSGRVPSIADLTNKRIDLHLRSARRDTDYFTLGKLSTDSIGNCLVKNAYCSQPSCVIY